VNIPLFNDFNKPVFNLKGFGTIFILIKTETAFIILNLIAMKRIFTISVLSLFTALLLTACVKDRVYSGIDEGYWLSKERGEVVYSSSTCNYYVIETANGYTLVRTYGSYRPSQGSIIYGNLSTSGTKDLYNRTYSVVFTGTITDYWMNYYDAQAALDYYCPLGKNQVREFKTSGVTK